MKNAEKNLQAVKKGVFITRIMAIATLSVYM